MYHQFITWLDRTQLSLLFKVTTWLVPTVQSVHILAIGVMLSAAVIVSLCLCGLSAPRISIARLSERLIPAMWWAMLVLLVSGIVLIIAEPVRTLNNPYFFAKVIGLVILVPLIRAFQLAVRRQPQRWSSASASSAAVPPIAAIAMVLLLAIIFCGRWIAYA